MTPAIGYIRVSTIEQASGGVSLAAQEKRIRDYCVYKGLELDELLVDAGVSASIPLFDRPAGEQLPATSASRVGLAVGRRSVRLRRRLRRSRQGKPTAASPDVKSGLPLRRSAFASAASEGLRPSP